MGKGSRGGRVGGLTLILSVGEGMWVKLSFAYSERGVRLNFEPYFTHFPTLHPGYLCTVPKVKRDFQSMLCN